MSTKNLSIKKEDKASLENSWKIYKAHFPTFATIFALSILVALLNWLLQFTTTAIISLIGYDYYFEEISASAQIITYLVNWINPITRSLSEIVIFLYFLVPILYFYKKNVITPGKLFQEIFKKPIRFLLAGLLFGVLSFLGNLFCIIPGIIIGYTYPTFLNKIATTDSSIFDSLKLSFQNVFKSKYIFSYLGLFSLFFVLSNLLTLITCQIGGIILIPLFAIFIQHLTFNKGIINS